MYLGRKTRASGSKRVKRGGSWNNDGANLRSAKRNSNTPSNRNNNIGFRVGFRVGFSGMDFS
jgi:formylglycine-generating enzyme required for sulfatase activity